MNQLPKVAPQQSSQCTRAGVARKIFRIVVSIMLMLHGTDKFVNFDSYAQTFPTLLGIPGPFVLAIATIAQLPCALCILAGVHVRWFIFPNLVVLLGAVAFIHLPNAVAGAELACLYAICLGLVWMESGPKPAAVKP